MDDRQIRLDAKVAHLTHAAVWSKRLGLFALVFGSANLVMSFCVAYSILDWATVGHPFSVSAVQAWANPSYGLMPAEMMSTAVLWIAAGWWGLRIRDGFSALVDIIDELAETI